MAPGSKSGLGDIARVRERVREYAEVREYASTRKYASTRASTRVREYARMFDGPNFGELKSSPQAGNIVLYTVSVYLYINILYKSTIYPFIPVLYNKYKVPRIRYSIVQYPGTHKSGPNWYNWAITRI